ncbi:hypothetical protein MBLNU230_g8244t1 [Neophaeotheca triangularis]
MSDRLVNMRIPPFQKVVAATAVSSFALLRYYPEYALRSSLTVFLIFTLLYSTYFVYSCVLYRHYFSPLRHLPNPEEHFIYGSSKRILKEPSGRPMQDWVETVPNDGLIRYSSWFRERLLVTSPKVLAELLVTRNYDFTKPPHFKNGVGRILGIGILFAEGDEHKLQRKMLMPAFAFRHVKELYPVFWDKSRELLDCLSLASKATAPTFEKGENLSDLEKEAPDAKRHAPGVIEVGEWVSRATLDIIGLSGMGQDFGALQDPNNKLSHTYRMVVNPSRMAKILQVASIFLPTWVVRNLPVKRNGELEASSEYIKQTCRDLIANKRRAMAEKDRVGKDILSVAMESGGFDDEDLVNQMMTFLIAGHETTATAMTWALYLLCRHPSIQQKLRNAIRSHLPSPTTPITSSQLDTCHYLQAVCSEVLRIWAPVPMTMRTACRPTQLHSQPIPAGTDVVISPWAINNCTALWGADATEFKPERWLDADGTSNNHGGAESNYSFLTFLHGPRSCIGQRFAVAEFACLLAGWVGRFETRFEEGSPLARGELEVKGGITSKPRGGLWVDLEEVGGW